MFLLGHSVVRCGFYTTAMYGVAWHYSYGRRLHDDVTFQYRTPRLVV